MPILFSPLARILFGDYGWSGDALPDGLREKTIRRIKGWIDMEAIIKEIEEDMEKNKSKSKYKSKRRK